MRRSAVVVIALLIALAPTSACSSGTSADATKSDRQAPIIPTIIDQSSPERLLYTALLAQAKGQEDAAAHVFFASDTGRSDILTSLDDATVCADDPSECDYYYSRYFQTDACPQTVSDVEAARELITYTHDPSKDAENYGSVRIDDGRGGYDCGFGVREFDGKWYLQN